MEKRKQEQNWRLRQARESRSWTQREVADQIDLLDVRNLRRWEAGEASPSLRYRGKLCKLFAMDAEELGLLPNVDPLLLAQTEQSDLTPPQSATEDHSLSATSLHSQPVPGREKWKRAQLLKKVNSFWVKGLLEPSFRDTASYKIEFYECYGMVSTPWTQIGQPQEWSMRPFPADTHITQIYDDACGELLILGESSVGMTTLLVELTRDLLARAAENEAHPIPVIFHLSSWPQTQQLLTNWLVEELSSRYQVPRQIGQSWVEDDHILPLLDGLDGVDPRWHRACIDAINAYRQQHGLVPLVLCCCREAYLDLGVQALLQRAIYIQLYDKVAQERSSDPDHRSHHGHHSHRIRAIAAVMTGIIIGSCALWFSRLLIQKVNLLAEMLVCVVLLLICLLLCIIWRYNQPKSHPGRG